MVDPYQSPSLFNGESHIDGNVATHFSTKQARAWKVRRYDDAPSIQAGSAGSMRMFPSNWNMANHTTKASKPLWTWSRLQWRNMQNVSANAIHQKASCIFCADLFPVSESGDATAKGWLKNGPNCQSSSLNVRCWNMDSTISTKKHDSDMTNNARATNTINARTWLPTSYFSAKPWIITCVGWLKWRDQALPIPKSKSAGLNWWLGKWTKSSKSMGIWLLCCRGFINVNARIVNRCVVVGL